nr:hypothetical protein [Kiritimatiellia bacterium]
MNKRFKAIALAAAAVGMVLSASSYGAPMTGDEIVKGNAAKKSGYSSAQLEKIAKSLKGKSLTFTGGELSSVSRGFDGELSATIYVSDPDSKESYPRKFVVRAEISDAANAESIESLDEGAKLKSVTGTVKYEGTFLFFTLADAKIVPADGVKADTTDYSSMTGIDIVKGN